MIIGLLEDLSNVVDNFKVMVFILVELIKIMIMLMYKIWCVFVSFIVIGIMFFLVEIKLC